MVGSSTTPAPARSSSPTAHTYTCPAHILCLRTVEPSASFAPSTMLCALLFQASMPPSYWVEGLHTATHLLNLLPTKTLASSTPHLALFGVAPSYDHLRVFSCACYPNLSSTAAHKLAPRSTLYVFLGYSAHHKGYRCLDLQSNRVIISRHVVFDETSFPFSRQSVPPSSADFEFLVDESNLVPVPIRPVHALLPTGTPPSVFAQPRAAASSAQPRAAVSGPSSTAPDAVLPPLALSWSERSIQRSTGVAAGSPTGAATSTGSVAGVS